MIYARSEFGATIEVYAEDSDILITTFENVQEMKKYKVYLTALSESYSTFDLKVIGDAQFDYIVDPVIISMSNVSTQTDNITVEGNYSHLTIDTSDDVYLEFDGDGDYVSMTVAEIENLDGDTNPISFSFWVNPDS